MGGHTRGEGRGVHHKATVVGAVEVRRGAPEVVQEKRKRQKHEKGCPVRGETYAGRLRLRHVPNRSKLALTSFMLDSVAKDTTIFTDGWHGYEALKRLGYDHESVTLGGDPKLAAAALPLIHLVFSNLKAWLIGTHHGVQHTPARQFGEFLASGTYIPPGDPVKMMQAMIDSVDLAVAPKRLVLGSDAYSPIHEVLTKRLAALEAQKEIALSTDADA